MIKSGKIIGKLVMAACVLTLSACGTESGIYIDEYEDNEEVFDDEEEVYEGEDGGYEEYGEEEYADSLLNTSNDARKLLLEEYEKLKAEALADPVRQKEVTPEATDIRIYDEISEKYSEVTKDVCTIEMNGRRMQYTFEVIGEPYDSDLYPLYITLHGGGGAAPELNNGEWVAMMDYYKYNVPEGIYVTVRGMEDVWNLHFLDDSYPMYDRLIEDMVLLKDADPNRVYLLGYSAGGDGVYAIAPRMADKFAAVNMSSGHPNGVSLINTSNLPFEIQVGIRDFYSDTALRSIRGAEFERTFAEYSKQYGHEYPHRVLVHVPNGHYLNDNFSISEEEYEVYGIDDPFSYSTNVLKDPTEFADRAIKENWVQQFLDIFVPLGKEEDVGLLSYCADTDFPPVLYSYVTDTLHMAVEEGANTNAVEYVSDFTRNPTPKSFVWDLSTRASKRSDAAFYWLKADYSIDKGVINAYYDEEDNMVYLESDGNVKGEVKILANPSMMDFSRPLTIVAKDQEWTVTLEANLDIAAASIRETGDINLAWADEVYVTYE